MNIIELRVYQESMKMAEEIWKIVIKWDYFCKDTIGKQLVRSADSIAANLSEGFGRFPSKKISIFVIILVAHFTKPRLGLQKHIIAH